MTCNQFLLIVSVCLITAIRGQCFNPGPDIQLLHPQGFQISVPIMHFGDISGKLRFRLIGRDADRQTGWFCYGGHWSSMRLTFRIEEASLKPGDVIICVTFITPSMGDYYSELRAFEVDEDHNGHLIIRNTRAVDSPDYKPKRRTVVPVVTTHKPPTADCTRSLTLVRDPTDRIPCVNELIFEDNFNDQLDKRLWRTEQRFSTQPDYEFNMYMDRSETVAIRDNVLVLGVHRLGNEFNISSVNFGPDCTGRKSSDECEVPENLSTLFTPPIAAGQLSTVRSFSFQYGRVEVRAKLPYANWIFPQVQLHPVEQAYGTENYESGLMRLTWGTPRENLYSGVLLGAGWPYRELGVCRWRFSELLWSRGFHNYSMDWRPDGITFAFDGTDICRIEAQTMQRKAANGHMAPAARKWHRYRATPMAPYDRLFYLQLGVGVAGFNDFGDEPGRNRSAKPWRNNEYHGKLSFWDAMSGGTVEEWPGTMANLMVDWIRVYAL